MLVTNWAVHPGNGITLETTALRVMCNTSAGRRKAMKFAPTRTPERISARNRSPASIFHEIFDFLKFRVMEPDLGPFNLRRCKFVSRFGHAKRKP